MIEKLSISEAEKLVLLSQIDLRLTMHSIMLYLRN